MNDEQTRQAEWARPKSATWTIGAAIVLAVVSVMTPLWRPLSQLEVALFQAGSLILGIYGAWVVGQHSAREAARANMQLHARGAFRRMLSLYSSISRLSTAIDLHRSNGKQSSDHALAVLQATVTEQIMAANDALEDWRDIVPDDVAAVEATIRRGLKAPEGER